MHGEAFEANLRLLKLGGCDIVLGVDWMKGVSSIRMKVTVEKKRRMTLTGSMETGVCKMI